jgi:hypothetical protein
LARAQLIAAEERAQETQRSILEDGAEPFRAPRRKNKLFKVTVSKAWRGLHEHLMNHALLNACVDELDQAGKPSKLPTGSLIFSEPDNYTAAIESGGELKACHILVTQPFLKALKDQVSTAPDVKIRRGMIRLLGTFFGDDGPEFRTISSPNEFKLIAEEDSDFVVLEEDHC